MGVRIVSIWQLFSREEERFLEVAWLPELRRNEAVAELQVQPMNSLQSLSLIKNALHVTGESASTALL
jgi:hypothetical protein